jgi:hypothetical protein
VEVQANLLAVMQVKGIWLSMKSFHNVQVKDGECAQENGIEKKFVMSETYEIEHNWKPLSKQMSG